MVLFISPLLCMIMGPDRQADTISQQLHPPKHTHVNAQSFQHQTSIQRKPLKFALSPDTSPFTIVTLHCEGYLSTKKNTLSFSNLKPRAVFSSLQLPLTPISDVRRRARAISTRCAKVARADRERVNLFAGSVGCDDMLGSLDELCCPCFGELLIGREELDWYEKRFIYW